MVANLVDGSCDGVHPGADLCECAGVDVGGGKMQDKIGTGGSGIDDGR